MQNDPNTLSFGRGRRCPAAVPDVVQRRRELPSLADDEGSRVCGPGWRARRGAESRECRGEATHDGGQDVSHDVTGKGNQKQSRAGAGRLPCNHTNGALSFFFHASDAAQDPNSAPHVQVLCRRAVS